MKKFIAMALATIISLSASASTSADTNNDAKKEFSTVKVFAPVHLLLVKAPFYSVRVMSRDKELASTVHYTIKDGVVRVSASDIEYLEQSYGHVTVVVTAPEDIEYKVGGDMKQVYETHHPFMKMMK